MPWDNITIGSRVIDAPMMPPCRAPRPSTPARLSRRALPWGLVLVTAWPAGALDLAWPEDAVRALARTEPQVAYPLATGPFDGVHVPTRTAEGVLSEEVWHLPGPAEAAMPLFRALRDQLDAQGFATGFTCSDERCGGFDFRYGLPIPGAPEMHVDLGAYHHMTARRPGPDGTEYVALTVSHGGQHSYAHLARIRPAAAADAAVTPSTRQADAERTAGLIARLTRTGAAVLDDLAFDTGASALSGQRYESLVTLADWLAEEPARRIVLVGHTDAEGALDANIALSEARAAAVREALVGDFGADPDRIEAAGVGYLAPRAANDDPAGRDANRRVEVVLVSR